MQSGSWGVWRGEREQRPDGGPGLARGGSFGFHCLALSGPPLLQASVSPFAGLDGEPSGLPLALTF